MNEQYSQTRYELALGALALEVWRQSNGSLEHADAYRLAKSYLAVRTIPASSESNEDAAREAWWQYREEKTLEYTYPDPVARRQQWYRDWRTNPKSRNLFRIIQKHTTTVFKKGSDYKYVVSTPDGNTYYSEPYTDLATACKMAHATLISLLNEVKV